MYFSDVVKNGRGLMTSSSTVDESSGNDKVRYSAATGRGHLCLTEIYMGRLSVRLTVTVGI